MPRYEFKEGSSSKFWQITLTDNTFTTRWGRIGTDGQEKTQSFDNAATAQKEYDKLVREKEKKGYELVGDGEGDDESGDDEGGESASNPELEAAIIANPDNADAYLVYGDWLQRQGDPRGELIALQHAAMQASGEEATKLKKQVSALLKSRKGALLGELAEATKEEELKVEWHLGFIRTARVGQKDYDSDREIGELLKELLAHPSARFLQELTLGMANFEENDYESTIAGLIEGLTALGGSKTIQRLFIGDFEYPDDTEISWSHLHDISALYKLLPNLRSLHLRGASLELGNVDLPELREFTIETGGLPLSAVKSIAAAKWPKLEKLEVWFGQENYGGEGGLDDIQPILDGKGLPELKSLGLCNAEFVDELCKVLPKAKVLPQLERLDLSRGTMSDEGARILAENAAAFAHLKNIDFTENMLTDEGERAVAKLCPSVAAGNQREFEEDYRYSAVGE